MSISNLVCSICGHYIYLFSLINGKSVVADRDYLNCDCGISRQKNIVDSVVYDCERFGPNNSWAKWELNQLQIEIK